MPAYEIEKLLPRHYRILDLTLEGLDQREIARALDIRRETVNIVQKSPVFQHELAGRRKKRTELADQHAVLEDVTAADRARSILEEALPAAAHKHVELLGCEDAAIAQRSANSILDRAFGKAGTLAGSDGGGPSISIHADQVQILQTALTEDRAIGGVND